MRRPVEKWVRWGWLFPAAYAVHILEEWRGGEGFPAWVSRVMGAELSVERFLALNAWALAGMTLGVVLTLVFRRMRWLLVGFGAGLAVGLLMHAVVTLLAFFGS